MWAYGKINGFEYQIKYFTEDSDYGINDGKISKLYLKGGKGWAFYDRGWDCPPTTPEAEQACQELIARYK